MILLCPNTGSDQSKPEVKGMSKGKTKNRLRLSSKPVTRKQNWTQCSQPKCMRPFLSVLISFALLSHLDLCLGRGSHRCLYLSASLCVFLCTKTKPRKESKGWKELCTWLVHGCSGCDADCSLHRSPALTPVLERQSQPCYDHSSQVSHFTSKTSKDPFHKESLNHCTIFHVSLNPT